MVYTPENEASWQTKARLDVLSGSHDYIWCISLKSLAYGNSVQSDSMIERGFNL